MDFQTSLLAFLILINLFIFLVLANDYRCLKNGNFTTNSTYHINLKILLSSLPSNMADNGFFNGSQGQNPDRVYAVALCQGDVQLDFCRACIQNATAELLSSCQTNKQAFVWANYKCLVRYSNESFLGHLDYDAIGDSFPYSYTSSFAKSAVKFNEALRTLLDELDLQAASGGSLVKVAAGNMTGPDFMTIFALLQCTPDLSQQDCISCLMSCAQYISSCCQNTTGYWIYARSCTLQYEVNPFYNITRIQEVQRILSTAANVPAPAPVSQGSLPPSGHGDHNKTRTIAIVVIANTLSLALIAGVIAIYLTKTRKKKQKEMLTSDNEQCTHEIKLAYDFNKINEATNNFSDDNKLGEGGFGIVYKGRLKDQDVAVKRLVVGSAQGHSEFQNEVLLLAKLQHRNLVRLLGFSQEGTERVLIYEFIHNASLDRYIFDPDKAHFIDWNMRFSIIKGIARGLLYLHEDSRLRVIHRDLKPSNILLDANMNPKIADFGIAKLFERDESEANTSKIAGTFGYMAPEYALHGQFSRKSDVYSFGVLVLEIISGQKNAKVDLIDIASQNCDNDVIRNMIDPVLQSTNGSFQEIIQCVRIALLCTQEDAFDRPAMASVVVMLGSQQ